MQNASNLLQEYVFAIFESGNLPLNKEIRSSFVANSRLCSAKNQVNLTLAILARFPTFEPDVGK